MGSMPPECWEKVVEEAPEMNGALLMALMDETHVEDAEDERLGCVIQSLEEEIGHSAVGNITGIPVKPECGNYQEYCMDYGLENMQGLLDGDDCSGSTCHISDPFDWVDVDMGHNWYLDTCTNEVGMVGFDDLNMQRECSSYYYYYGDASVNEDAYSPLWQES